jgi:hypothetical protein
MVPVNADVPDLDVFFVDEEDKHVNPSAAKGLAELSLVGSVPAVANTPSSAARRKEPGRSTKTIRRVCSGGFGRQHYMAHLPFHASAQCLLAAGCQCAHIAACPFFRSVMRHSFLSLNRIT